MHKQSGDAIINCNSATKLLNDVLLEVVFLLDDEKSDCNILKERNVVLDRVIQSIKDICFCGECEVTYLEEAVSYSVTCMLCTGELLLGGCSAISVSSLLHHFIGESIIGI